MRDYIRAALGQILLAFGGFSVHSTSCEDAGHHREWAEEHGMPAPQPAITVLGWASIAGGVLCIATTVRSRMKA